MKISIIIGNYNTCKLTSECIRSIFKYPPKYSFEVIVVDDASPDGSGMKLKELERDYKKLKVILNMKNQGFVGTNNKALRISKGDYKLLLNSDTVVKFDSINNLVIFADNTKDAGVVGSRLLNLDGSIQESCYNFPTLSNVINYKKFSPTGGGPTVVDAVVGAAFLITPSAYKLIGGLNTKYISYFEDLDYCREVYRNGLKVYYLPESIVIHYHGESFKQLSNLENQWKKLIPSSIAYHGVLKHYLLFLVSWTWQKLNRLLTY
jgi:GT2 family glycosyltransferase